MSQPSNSDIMGAIGELRGLMVGVDQRLDVLNGRTAKTEDKVQIIENSRAKERGYITGIVSVFSIIGGLVSAWLAK
jgi:hypothetical protein